MRLFNKIYEGVKYYCAAASSQIINVLNRHTNLFDLYFVHLVALSLIIYGVDVCFISPIVDLTVSMGPFGNILIFDIFNLLENFRLILLTIMYVYTLPRLGKWLRGKISLWSAINLYYFFIVFTRLLPYSAWFVFYSDISEIFCSFTDFFLFLVCLISMLVSLSIVFSRFFFVLNRLISIYCRRFIVRRGYMYFWVYFFFGFFVIFIMFEFFVY